LDLFQDKNRHPDSKLAFDALADAYDVLSHPDKHKEYYRELQRQRKASKLTWKRFIHRFQEFYHNLYSWALYTISRSKNKQEIEELQQWKKQLKEGLYVPWQDLKDHLILLPSKVDRFKYINELLIEKKWLILVSIFALSSMLLPKSDR
jgi:hypothetical protein